ncbi:MAG: hypothetical protein ABIP44_05120 [Pseudoxanthomonas sp.]
MATSDALLLTFKAGETRNTVSRKTVKQLASILGFNENQVVLYALAKLREDLVAAYPSDAPELSATAIKRIRSQVMQNGYKPTRTLIKGL